MRPGESAPYLAWSEDGTAAVVFGDLDKPAWREPICPVCKKPVRWVLDMMSCESGSMRLGHAHCLWRRAAFVRERELAPDDL